MGRLVLLRHGQSVWNLENRFAGWTDVDLSDYGMAEAHNPMNDDELPSTECLKDTLNRVLPYWYKTIEPALKDGEQILIAAHGNSLRALVKYLYHLSDD